MLNFDNIFSLSLADNKISKKKEGRINLVSHGHFDHLPSRTKHTKFICSDETRKIIEHRKKRYIDTTSSENIKMLDAGHTIGSKMFFLKEKEFLFTGDFNTTDKGFLKSAEPIKCKTLVIDSTFGHPEYIFPEYTQEVKRMIDFIKDKKKVLLDAYTFGKSQELCYILNKNKIRFNVSPNIYHINKVLKLNFKYFDKNEKDVIIGSFSNGYDILKDISGYAKIGVSGWAITGSAFTRSRKLTAGFIISDHNDFPSLIKFVEKCNPETVFTFHGYDDVFAHYLRQRGFDAKPLFQKQALLTQFK